MPHQVIEYSANLDDSLDIDGLVGALHETAVSIDALPTGGIRTRAVRREVFRVADGHPDNAFINVTLRIAEGRPLDVQKATGQKLFDELKRFVSEIYQIRPIALSFEIQEIKPDTRWKESNIRDYMASRSGEQ
jgi:5-carboxymethyl-2-hydroxymuconate isomerase